MTSQPANPLDDLMARLIKKAAGMDPSSPDAWRSAFTDCGNALLAACELVTSHRARFAQLVATGDPDAVHGAVSELVDAIEELQGHSVGIVSAYRHLDAGYHEWREAANVVSASRKPPEG